MTPEIEFKMIYYLYIISSKSDYTAQTFHHFRPKYRKTAYSPKTVTFGVELIFSFIFVYYK